MLQIETYINNELRFIDLFDEEKINMSVSFAEVQDITKKNSTFSQSFKVPGSKNNNDIFNHYYDFSASIFEYNPLDKFDAQITNNGYIIYDGYIRLNGVSSVENDITYDITFYSEIGNVIANIQDKFLSDLDLTDLNFTGVSQVASAYTIDSDLDPSLKNDPRSFINGKSYFSVISKGYEYSAQTGTQLQTLVPSVCPVLDWPFPGQPNNTDGFWDSAFSAESITRFVPYYYYTPTLQIKELYTRIFSEAGYNINSDFFDTAYFERYYLPLTFTSNSLFPSQYILPQFVFEDTQPLGITTTSVGWDEACWTILSGSPVLVTASTLNVERIPTQIITEDNGGFSTGAPLGFTLPLAGLYTMRLSVDITVTGPASGNQGSADFYLHQRGDGVLSGGTPFNSGCTLWTGFYRIEEGTSNDYIFDFTIDNNNPNSFMALDMKIIPPPGNPSVLSYVKFEILDGPYVVSGDTWNWSEEILAPDIKQMDFISSVNKLFNLLVLPEPNVPNTLRIEPIIDWIGKGETLDWTNKVDRKSPITVYPLNSIINGTLNYTYEDDKGSTNQTFKNSNDRLFGQNIIQLNQDFKDNILSFNNIFSAQVDVTLNVTVNKKGLTIPTYYNTQIQENEGLGNVNFLPYKSSAKLLFRSSPIPINSSRKSGNDYWNTEIPGLKQYYWYNNNRCVTYPFGASGLTHYNIWNKSDFFDTQEFNLSEGYEDLYDIYYSDYIQDLMNPDNRLVNLKAFFLPEEITQLKWNEKIFIDGTIFRVNKITNLDLMEPGLANVELVKLTKDYRPHRVLYYDLISCTGGTELHTSTDLNFSIYAFRDYWVEIDGICYLVQLGTYNPSYTYQALNISSVYSSCDCNTTLLDAGGYTFFYDDRNPIPPPSPSPSSPAGCPCYEYSIENENPFAVSVQYTDCDGDTQFVLIQAVSRGIICACQNSIINPGNISIEELGICEPPPTPSLTPTPSITPSACFCRNYTVYNPFPYAQSFSYLDCYGVIHNITLPGIGLSSPFCACNGSVVAPNTMVINAGAACFVPSPSPSKSPTPTPTPTRTLTPTPTPSISPGCLYKSWTIEECQDGTCSGGFCSCNASLTRTVYTDCSVNNITDPGTAIYTNSTLTNPFTADFILPAGTIIYNSSGSGVTVVCFIGGPC